MVRYQCSQLQRPSSNMFQLSALSLPPPTTAIWHILTLRKRLLPLSHLHPMCRPALHISHRLVAMSSFSIPSDLKRSTLQRHIAHHFHASPSIILAPFLQQLRTKELLSESSQYPRHGNSTSSVADPCPLVFTACLSTRRLLCSASLLLRTLYMFSS